MNRPRPRLIAISLLCLLLSLSCPAWSQAGEPAGTIVNLSGPLLAKGESGATRALAKASEVLVGDLLVTGKRTYAKIRFIDKSEVTLRPETEFLVEGFSYQQESPAGDNALLQLVKGGMRAITGEVGKRGDVDSYQIKTPSATIGIRGTIYEVRLCEDNCGGLPNGLYLHVLQGSIVAENDSGSLEIGAGQFGYIADESTPPVLLPEQPLIDFSLPPEMTDNSSGPAYGGTSVGMGSCEVR